MLPKGRNTAACGPKYFAAAAQNHLGYYIKEEEFLGFPHRNSKPAAEEGVGGVVGDELLLLELLVGCCPSSARSTAAKKTAGHCQEKL